MPVGWLVCFDEARVWSGGGGNDGLLSMECVSLKRLASNLNEPRASFERIPRAVHFCLYVPNTKLPSNSKFLVIIRKQQAP